MNIIKTNIDIVRQKLLGHNNEKLDLIVDSFYKLSSEQRKIAIGITIGTVSLFIILGLFSYFSALQSLEKSLFDNHTALRRVTLLKSRYHAIDKGFQSFKSKLASSKRNFNLKAMLNSYGSKRKLTIDFDDVHGSTLPLSMRSDFAVQVVRVTIRKVSLRSVVDFLRKINESDKFLRINNLTIDRRYDNIQYFNISANVSSLKPI